MSDVFLFNDELKGNLHQSSSNLRFTPKPIFKIFNTLNYFDFYILTPIVTEALFSIVLLSILSKLKINHYNVKCFFIILFLPLFGLYLKDAMGVK